MSNQKYSEFDLVCMKFGLSFFPDNTDETMTLIEKTLKRLIRLTNTFNQRTKNINLNIISCADADDFLNFSLIMNWNEFCSIIRDAIRTKEYEQISNKQIQEKLSTIIKDIFRQLGANLNLTGGEKL